MDSPKELENTLYPYGTLGSSPEARAGRLAPLVLSTNVSKLEQSLSMGLAAKYKLTATRVFMAGVSTRFVRPVGIYALSMLVVIALSAWVASTVFSGSRAYVLPGTAVPQSFTTGSANKELVRSFENVLIQSHPNLVEQTTLAARATLIRTYLEKWNSPLAEYAEIIAQQPHWKRVLAISFAESGLGKRCADNNCSGIGVEPGHPNWQAYETKGDWVRAMNRLLEKRYKDWALEKMNGVYNQPGSSNWVLATNRIMQELEQLGIE